MRKAVKTVDVAKRGVKGRMPGTAAEAAALLQELRLAAEAGVEVRLLTGPAKISLLYHIL